MTSSTESRLRECLESLLCKRAMLRLERGSLATLVLGDEHADYGFDPAGCPGAFNLASARQDLKYAFFLYDKLVGRYPTLKTVVVFYSAFSSGFLLEGSTPLGQLAPVLNEVFQLGLQYDDTHLVEMARGIHGRFVRSEARIEGCRGFLPRHGKIFSPARFDWKRVADSLADIRRGTDADFYLARLLVLARHLGHRVIVVIPPVRPDFAQALSTGSAGVFARLHGILDDYRLEGRIELLDCRGDSRFTADQFGDHHYLDPLGEGTQILSDLIRDRLQ